VFRDTVIAHNVTAYTGAGVSASLCGKVVFENCAVLGNSCAIGGWGAGLFFYSQTGGLEMTNTTVAFNVTPSVQARGGGIYVFSSQPSALTNLTVFGNRSGDGVSTGLGGGIYVDLAVPKRVVIRNSIVWANESAVFPQIGGYPRLVTYCDVQGGFTGDGNIDLDPQFVDAPASDFHLIADSRCINAGSNDAPLPELDFEGDPRIMHGTADMGVDEFAHCYLAFAGFGSGLPGSGGFVPELTGTGHSCPG